MLLSSMSDGTAGNMLRRSAAWVRNRRAELAATMEPVAKVAVEERPAINGGLDVEEAPPPAEAAPEPLSSPPIEPEPAQPALSVSPERARYIRWFLAARWPMREIAELFDVPPRDLELIRGAPPC